MSSLDVELCIVCNLWNIVLSLFVAFAFWALHHVLEHMVMPLNDYGDACMRCILVSSMRAWWDNTIETDLHDNGQIWAADQH